MKLAITHISNVDNIRPIFKPSYDWTYQSVIDVGDKLFNDLWVNAPVDSGDLRDSIIAQAYPTPNSFNYAIAIDTRLVGASINYAWFAGKMRDDSGQIMKPGSGDKSKKRSAFNLTPKQRELAISIWYRYHNGLPYKGGDVMYFYRKTDNYTGTDFIMPAIRHAKRTFRGKLVRGLRKDMLVGVPRAH